MSEPSEDVSQDERVRYDAIESPYSIFECVHCDTIILVIGRDKPPMSCHGEPVEPITESHIDIHPPVIREVLLSAFGLPKAGLGICLCVIGEGPMSANDVAEALDLESVPDRLIILGGGYIAVELGYYYQSMGAEVVIIEMEETLVPREDAEIAQQFTDIASDRHEVYTEHRVTRVEEESGEYRAHTEGPINPIEIEGDEILVSLGCRPNTDRLNLEATSIVTDEHGFTETNEYLETTAENIWAQGDVAGNALFKHSGDYETQHTIAIAVHSERRAVDLSALPHVIFTGPQIAGVGAIEAELRENDTTYQIGTSTFPDSSMGRAMKLDHGMMKIMASPEGELLGAHAIGYEASTLMHEVVLAMRTGISVEAFADTIHVHPSLSKIVESAIRDLASAFE